MKQLFCRILCLAILSVMLLVTGCGADGTASLVSNEKSDGTFSEPAESSESEEFTLFSNLPEVSYGGATFTVLVEGDYMGTYRSVELVAQEGSYDTLNNAITERNDLIEERFDVKIAEERTTSYGEMVTVLRDDSMAGTSAYDMIMPFMGMAATLATDDILLELNSLDNIHLEEDYYDRGSVSDLSVDGKNYFVTGDLSLLAFAGTHAMVFNKDMIVQYGLEDPYDLVKSGNWTLDKLWEMSKGVTKETDGTSGMGYKDTYGFLVNDNFYTSMFIAAGQRLTAKDSNDRPIVALDSESAVRVYDKIYTIVNDTSSSCQFSTSSSSFRTTAEAAGKSVWDAATEAVADDRALFRAIAVIDILDLGEYECGFGVLPIPKYDALQEKYYTSASPMYASCVAIPANVKDPEMSAVITDALMQASTETSKEAYFQVIMKERKIQDTESEEMLQLIFDTRVYDLAFVYNWGGADELDGNSISGFMNIVAASDSNTYVSKWQSILSAVLSKMDETMELYDMLD